MAKRIKGQDRDNCQCHRLSIRIKKFSRDQNTSGNVYFQIFYRSKSPDEVLVDPPTQIFFLNREKVRQKQKIPEFI